MSLRFIVLLLLALDIATAVGVVMARHRHRQLFVELNRLEKTRDELNVDFSRLQGRMQRTRLHAQQLVGAALHQHRRQAAQVGQQRRHPRIIDRSRRTASHFSLHYRVQRGRPHR